MKNILTILSVFVCSFSFGQVVTNKGYIVDTTTIVAGRLALKMDKGSVTENKIYYRGERIDSMQINTSTGALSSSSSGTDISGYLAVPPNESIRIFTRDSVNTVIYGWAYDSSLTAISEIRSNSLISTQALSYTFTTPANTAYINIYVKHTSSTAPAPYWTLSVESASTITYTTPIVPESYTGTTIQKIQQALDFARYTSSPVVLRDNLYLITSAIIMNSGNTLVVNGAKIKLATGTHDNLIRNEAVYQPSWRIFARGNRNVKILGYNGAQLEGSGESNWGSDNPSGVGTEGWRSNGIRLANVEDFEISGFRVKNTNANAMDFEQCRFGTIRNITFDMGREHLNQGGVELMRGSHHILIENIGGTVQDDIVAMNNILGNERLHILGTTIYDPLRTNLDMSSITVKNINRVTGTSLGGAFYGGGIRLLTSDTLKLYDVIIDGVSGKQQIEIQSSSYFLTTPAALGDMYNVVISNAQEAYIRINKPIQDFNFFNVARTDVTRGFNNIVLPNTSRRIHYKFYDGDYEYIDSLYSGTPLINNWKITGNARTNGGQHYIGTSDNHTLTFRANNISRMKIDSVAEIKLLGQTAGTSTNPIMSTYDNGNTVRSTMYTSGSQTWWLNSGSGEVGRIAYSTPASLPGILFFDAAGNSRSEFRHVAGGGFSWGSGSGSGAVTHTMFFSNSGFLGLGQTPTAILHLKAGTATASTAPLKFTAGVVLTTPVSGNMETDATNNLYYTNSSATRARVGMWRYVAKTSTYTATDADYTIDCTSGTFTVTLPTAVGIEGRVYIIKNSGAGTITMAGTSSQTFDGAASPTIAAGAVAQYQSNNANWIKIN